MGVEYPDRLALRTIRNEGTGGCVDRVSLSVPMIVGLGEEFSVKIAVVDELGLAACDFPKRVFLELPEMNCSWKVDLPEAGPPLAKVFGIQLGKEGIYRFKVDLGGGREFFSNPCIVKNEPAHKIYWGDPHVHTVLSQCHPDRCRSLAFGFQAARYLSCLDWVAAADHVSNGRCELARWKEETAGSNMYNDPPHFATLPAYEASLKGGCGGDNNVYMTEFPSLFVDDYEEGNVKTLSEKLKAKAVQEGFDFFIVPHHTTRTGKHGELSYDIYPGEERMPVVEIHSKWGTSEYRGNPNPLKEIHPGPSYVVDLLQNGFKLGFIGGTDTHATLTFTRGAIERLTALPGITAVKSDELSRENIFNAIRQRDCYAAAGERIYLDFCSGDNPMGSVIKIGDTQSLKFQITAAAAGKITSVDVVKNGDTVQSFTPDDWRSEFEYEDEHFAQLKLKSGTSCKFNFYYVRVTCESGGMAWSSPIWITE